MNFVMGVLFVLLDFLCFPYHVLAFVVFSRDFLAFRAFYEHQFLEVSQDREGFGSSGTG